MIRFRPTEPQDEWAVWTLRREIQPDLSQAAHSKWWSDVFEHRFMAYDGPVLVGVLRITPQRSCDLGRGLVHLQVAKREQRKGLGTQMLSKIQRIARDLGFTHLDAEVCSENIASQKAFLGAEFQPTRFSVML